MGRKSTVWPRFNGRVLRQSRAVKPAKLDQLTVEQLVARFIAICLDQDRAILYDEIARYNRLFNQMELIKPELKSRPGDQRRALQALYEHPNLQVRLKAAKATLALAPESARAVIEQIAATSKGPHAGDAGMTLVKLDRGIFKPE